MAFSFSASGAARWLVSVAMRLRLLCRLIERGQRLVQRRFARLQFDLERLRIDAIQRIAGLHLAALLEQALDDDAGDARTNLRNPGRRDAAGQFPDDGAGLRPHREGPDFGLGRCCDSCGYRRRFIASSQ